MAKTASTFELTLQHRTRDQTRGDWLYTELRGAILAGRLKAGVRLPATREFARLHGLSRGTVVGAFDRLQAEGYLSSRVGRGTWVNEVLAGGSSRGESSVLPAYLRTVISEYKRPKTFVGWVEIKGLRPFQMRDPALAEFPAELWGRIAAKRARNFRTWLKEEDDGLGYRPLREAVANYLGSSRGVRCTADQVAIVSGVQQGLDLLARLLLKPGDPVWMEDPGYFGASIAFVRAGAKLIPVPVDEHGLSVQAGMKACDDAKGVYLTPGHQFPLGMLMPASRRMEVLKWASRTGAFVIEDDYDSEYRFDGQPPPALQGMDQGSSVIFIGTFRKLLFPALRLGYVVLPPALVDTFISFRRGSDLRPLGLDEAVLCDFIVAGHFGRHLRRMRHLYAGRLEALKEGGRRYLQGLLEVSDAKAGLYTAAFLRDGKTSREAEALAAAHQINTKALDRFTLECPDPKGLLLGFAACDEKSIRQGVIRLAAALDARSAPRRS